MVSVRIRCGDGQAVLLIVALASVRRYRPPTLLQKTLLECSGSATAIRVGNQHDALKWVLVLY